MDFGQGLTICIIHKISSLLTIIIIGFMIPVLISQCKDDKADDSRESGRRILEQILLLKICAENLGATCKEEKLEVESSWKKEEL